jgi:hypothetical protein
MIRRNHTHADGTPGWLLIQQVEHARVSAELAAGWGAPGWPALVARGELLPAILHHDDGWTTWDAAPGLDPAQGRPRDFLEMQLADALPIWRRSIDRCAAIGPLAGYVVSQHFQRLLALGSDHRSQRAGRQAADFLAEQAALCQQRFAQWQAQSPDSHTLEQAGRAADQLRQFDFLSLWLCCRERRAAESISVAGMDRPLVFTPCANNRVAVDPWPYALPEFTITATGRWVPQRRYGSTAELLAACADELTLGWTLRAAG